MELEITMTDVGKLYDDWLVAKKYCSWIEPYDYVLSVLSACAFDGDEVSMNDVKTLTEALEEEIEEHENI